MEKGYIKKNKNSDLDRVTLELKSKASYKGQVMLSSGVVLTFINGKMSVTKEVAKQLLKENNDFEEVR